MDDDVGTGFIEGGAIGQHIGQRLAGLHGDAPGAHILDAPLQLLHGDVEIDHGAQRLQVRSALFPQHGAAAGGDDVALAGDGADGLLLTVEEGIYAPGVDDILQQGTLPVLDDQIHVQEGVAKGLGQQHAHRALARAGHADQGNVFHGKTAFLSLVSDGFPQGNGHTDLV